MQDIIPQKRNQRGPVTVPLRDSVEPNVSRTVYTRQTKMDDVVSHQEVVVTETLVTDYASTPMVRPIEHLSPESKTLVLQKALMSAQRELRKERRKRRDIKRFSLVVIASAFVLVTGYVSIDTWMTNNEVKAEISEQKSSVGAEDHRAAEGRDETEPTAQTLGSYQVAPDLPKALYINRINVAARILPMGVNNDNSIQAPKNIFDAGWYNGSVKPGEVGAMFIDAHASGPTREGLFAYLDRLAVGDELQVEKGDGTRLTYRVVHTEVANLDEIDMKKMLLPHGNALRGMNLMTCAGEWLADKETYNQRVMVWTEQV